MKAWWRSIVNEQLVANETPRNLKLAHGQRALAVTLENPSDQDGNVPLQAVTLSMENPADQAQLAELLAAGQVRAVHSHEATLEEVFIEVAGIRPAESRKRRGVCTLVRCLPWSAKTPWISGWISPN